MQGVHWYTSDKCNRYGYKGIGKGENIMAVSFLNSFLSYLVLLVIIAAVGAVAITLGITLRKKKNAAEAKNASQATEDAQ